MLQTNLCNLSLKYFKEYSESIIADILFIVSFFVAYEIFKRFLSKRKKKTNTRIEIVQKSKWENIEDIGKFHSMIYSNSDKKMDAYKIIKIMKKNGCNPINQTYNYLMEMSFKNDQLEIAMNLFEDINNPKSDVKPDVISYNIHLKQILSLIRKKQRNISEVKTVLKMMEEKDINLNEITFNTSIDAAIENNDLEYAWELYEKMKNTSEIKPDNYTYSTLLKGTKTNDNFSLEKAKDIFESAKLNMGEKIDEIVYNSMLNVYVHYNEIDSAVSLFNEMKNKKIRPSSVTYSILIKGFGQNKDIKNSIKIYDEMRNNGFIVNDITYGCLLNIFAKANREDLLETFYNQMQKEGIEPNIIIYSTMINGYTNSKKYIKAIELFDYIKEYKPEIMNLVLFNSILDCCEQSNQIKLLMTIYNELKIISKKREDLIPNIFTYSIVIKALARSDKEEAKKIYLSTYDLFKKEEFDELFFISVIEGFSKANDKENVLKIFEDMKRIGIQQTSVVYSIIMKMYSRLNEFDNVLKLHEQMKKEKISPSIISHTIIMQMYIGQKKIKEAMQIFEEIQKNIGADSVSYNFIINGCSFNQKLEYALDYLFQALKKKIKLNDETYNNVVRYLIENKFMKFNERRNIAQNLLKEFKLNNIRIREEYYYGLLKLSHNEYQNRKTGYSSKPNYGRKYYSNKENNIL